MIAVCYSMELEDDFVAVRPSTTRGRKTYRRWYLAKEHYRDYRCLAKYWMIYIASILDELVKFTLNISTFGRLWTCIMQRGWIWRPLYRALMMCKLGQMLIMNGTYGDVKVVTTLQLMEGGASDLSSTVTR